MRSFKLVEIYSDCPLIKSIILSGLITFLITNFFKLSVNKGIGLKFLGL